jgi:Ca2+/H+ antiporter, TMEM165/GDT1 family
MVMNEEKNTMDGNYCRRRSRKWWVLIPLFVIAMVFIMGAVVMYLWNAVMPGIFHLGTITYCQAILLLILSKILFGGFRGGRGFGRGGRFGRGREWKEKWMSMSEEERAKFKEEWKNRCC